MEREVEVNGLDMVIKTRALDLALWHAKYFRDAMNVHPTDSAPYTEEALMRDTKRIYRKLMEIVNETI